MPFISLRQLFDRAAEHAAGVRAFTGKNPLAHAKIPATRIFATSGGIPSINRIRAINERIPNTHRGMHLSSSVPQDGWRSSRVQWRYQGNLGFGTAGDGARWAYVAA